MKAAAKPIDVFIQLILLGGLLLWCGLILAPFSSIIIWAIIMAVALHPVHIRLSTRLGNRRGVSATLMVMTGIAIVMVPGYFTGQSLYRTASSMKAHMSKELMQVPQLPLDWHTGAGVKKFIADRWPADDGALAELVQQFGPELRDAGLYILGSLGTFGMDLMKFLASILLAGVVLAYYGPGRDAANGFFIRAIGPRGPGLVVMAAATVRNVAKGILGVALIQTTILSIGLFVAQVPAAGFLALLGLILAIVQIGVGPVAIGAVVYAWATMDTLPAILLTIWMVITTLSDNILRPILLGHGAPAPTAVIFLGAIGGFLLSGIIGLFTGAVILSIGYRLMLEWVGSGHGPAPADGPSTAAQADL